MLPPSSRSSPHLGLALTISALAHLLPLSSSLFSLPEPPPPPRLQVALQAPKPEPPPPPPDLFIPEASAPKPLSAAPPKAKTAARRHLSPPASWTESVRRQWQALDETGDFYPRAAIAQGLEGTAEVFFILDESGSTVAARIEQTSGHRLLDEAALRAVRRLRSLPADAPREAVLPVRFRLR